MRVVGLHLVAVSDGYVISCTGIADYVVLISGIIPFLYFTGNSFKFLYFFQGWYDTCNIITSLFNKRNKLVQRTTRQSEHYNLPLLGGSILEKSIFTQGPKIFNQIIKDGNIDLKCSIHNFKRHVKNKLVRNLNE